MAFVAGACFAAVLTGRSLNEPIAEPFFGLEEAREPAAPAEVRDEPAAPARPAVGGFADMAAALAQPPERLALAEGFGPIAGQVQSQALPAADDRGASRVEHTTAASDAPAPQPVLDTAVAEPELIEVEAEAGVHPPLEELKALVDRVRMPPHEQDRPDGVGPPQPKESPPSPAPLPGEEWNDPERVNWSDAAADQGQATGSAASPLPAPRRRAIFPDRRGAADGGAAAQRPVAPLRGGRLLERLRGERRAALPGADQTAAASIPQPAASGGWPVPVRLFEQLEQVAQSGPGGAAAAHWAAATRLRLEELLATAGPADPQAEAALLSLGDQVPEGMAAGDAATDPPTASLTRRAALAVARRVATWRAAAALCGEVSGPAAPTDDVGARLAGFPVQSAAATLLDAVERFEAGTSPADAAAAKAALQAITATSYARAADLGRTIVDHYLSPNVRIAVHRRFVERMMPEATVKTSPMQDFVLGRKVRGTSTVEQSTSIAFVPDADRIRLELLVRGEVASRTVTDAGPAAIHTRGAASFTVRKPVTLSAEGLSFGTALGSASNQSQLGAIQTSFDGVPIMGSLVQRIVRNQHDENKSQATREVNEKILVRACREVDLQSEPKFSEAAERIRQRIWSPMVELGLEPTAVAMESTAATATVRLRLAAASQLAAHTPRPRAPADAMLGLQVHESTLNNGCERLGLAGNRFALEDLIRLVCRRIGVEPRIPDDLPEGVSVTFAAAQPVRLECRDGQVRLRLALDAIESGRRNWYDIVAEVAYQPTSAGPQVLLERVGQVHLPGHKGLEIPLRTIFSKIFPKERPIALLPVAVSQNPRLADLRAVQVVSTDGWFALALDAPAEGPAVQAGKPQLPAAQGRLPRRR